MQAGGFQIKSPTVVVVSVNPAAQITAEQICGGHGTAHQTAPDIHTLVIPVDQCPPRPDNIAMPTCSLLFRSPGTGADQVLPSLSSDMPLALSCGGRPVALPGAARRTPLPLILVRSRDRRSRGLCLQEGSAPRA